MGTKDELPDIDAKRSFGSSLVGWGVGLGFAALFNWIAFGSASKDHFVSSIAVALDLLLLSALLWEVIRLSKRSSTQNTAYHDPKNQLAGPRFDTTRFFGGYSAPLRIEPDHTVATAETTGFSAETRDSSEKLSPSDPMPSGADLPLFAQFLAACGANYPKWLSRSIGAGLTLFFVDLFVYVVLRSYRVVDSPGTALCLSGLIFWWISGIGLAIHGIVCFVGVSLVQPTALATLIAFVRDPAAVQPGVGAEVDPGRTAPPPLGWAALPADVLKIFAIVCRVGIVAGTALMGLWLVLTGLKLVLRFF